MWVYPVEAIILFVLINLYFMLAKRLGIIDVPNVRSSHEEPTIRGGGVIFYGSLILFFFFSKFVYPWFFAGMTLVAIISMWDDIKHVPYYYRLPVQLLAVVLLLHQLHPIDKTELWVILMVMVVAGGVVNAFNFMDGINGMTGLYSLVTLFGFWLYDKFVFDFVDSRLMLFIAVGVMVFLFYNFRKRAVTFAGDVGAATIAFMIIFLLIKLMIKTENPIFILFLAVYGVDSVLTIFLRILKRENIFQAHRQHLYQVLVHSGGYSHLMVATIYAGIQLVIDLAVISVADQPFAVQFFYALGILFTLTLLYAVFKIRYMVSPRNPQIQ